MRQDGSPSSGNDLVCQAPSIMQVVPRLEAGATARSTVDLSSVIVRSRGRSVVVSDKGRMTTDLLRTGAVHIPARVDGDGTWQLARLALTIARYAKRHQVELIHSRSPATAWAAALAKRHTGIPYVVTLHDRFTPDLRRHRWFADAVRGADHVIAVSNFMAHHAAKDLKLDENRLAIIPNGLNLTRFNPGGVIADRVIKLAQRWLLPDGVPLILAPGRLTPAKGHETVIDALTKLGDRPFVCFFPGDDKDSSKDVEKYRAGLEALVISRGLEGKVRFVGFCEDMPAAYMLADVVVSANTEPPAFDLVTAEAQAMGRPVIASDLGASPELIIPDQTGWLVPPSNAEALSNRIADALALTVSARESIAILARERIERHYSLDQMCAKTLALYRTVLDRKIAAQSAA